MRYLSHEGEMPIRRIEHSRRTMSGIEEEDQEFSFSRKFQTEEVMLILEAYIANLDVFKNQTTLCSDGKPMTRKMMIQQIADNCTLLGHGIRTPKQIEQKLRDEFKKLRKFKTELSSENRRQIGKILVWPKASQGTIFLYNNLCDPGEQVEVDFTKIEKIRLSIEPEESTVNDQTLTSLQSILEAAMSGSVSGEESVVSPTPSSVSKEVHQPTPRKKARLEAIKPEILEKSPTLPMRNDETEKLKQEYYRELIRNERLVGELLQIRIEKEKRGIDTTSDRGLEAENELGVIRRI